MAIPPHSLPELEATYQAQFDIPYSGFYDVSPTQQLYMPHSIGETNAFARPIQGIESSDAVMQHQAMQPSNSPVLHPSHAWSDVELTGNSHSTSLALVTGPASPMAHPIRQRKRKAATLRPDDWEPYKNRILDLHIEQKRPLPEVRQILEEEHGFKAGLRQYRLRISQWGKDKNIKPQEMQAIVRKRQKRKLVETDKGQLAFKVRGSEVDLQKIERWMKRHDVVDSALYAPSPAAPTPSDVGCYTITERGSPATTTISAYSPVASVLSPGNMYLLGQSPQMPSPALSISSHVRPQSDALTVQSPALSLRSLPSLQVDFIHDSADSESAINIAAHTRYRVDEEQSLRYQILEAEMSPTSSTVPVSDMLYRLGGVLIDQGRYMAAEDIIRRLVDFHERHSGGSDDSPDALRALDLLGQAIEHQGLYAEAGRLFRRALQGREMVLTSEHPDTLTTMENLARVFLRQGRVREAEEQSTKLQILCMRVLGPLHKSTLMSMTISARVLYDLGRHEEAASSYTKVLALQERVLGIEHVNTLAVMDDLAKVLCALGRHEEAEVQAKKTVGLRMKVSGPEHPDTLMSQRTLAEVLVFQGRYEDAGVIHRETLSCCKKVLGLNHPDTLVSKSRWAYLLYEQGKYQEAETVQAETLTMLNNVLGPEAYYTLMSMDCLALVLQRQGRSDEAEAMSRGVMSLFEKVLGFEHPATLVCMNNRASVLYDQGRYDEVEAIDRKTLVLRKKVLGLQHPDTLQSVQNLRVVLERLGRFEEVSSIE